MKLIIGGAFQGKMEFAKEKYNLTDEDIFMCTADEIDFSKACIYGIEEFVYACIQNGTDLLKFFTEHKEEWSGSILICQDIFCGVVPLGADMREWRQVTGQLCKYLSGEAESVSRIFCGLEQKLK
ncbi:MAG: cobalamin biosynthesis protein CobU [Firmicutes bacterium]|nr:cobalamin biosynthesis protein CobU [Bacillota bacterium]